MERETDASTAAGEWRRDPWHRFTWRYWDGTWTNRKADASGKPGFDGVFGAGRVDADLPPADVAPPGPPQVAAHQEPPTFQQAVFVAQKNNGFAIASMVLGIVWIYWIGSVLAIVFGHIALRQIRGSRGAERGEGMAKAGIILGYVGVGIVALLLLVFGAIAFIGGSSGSSNGLR
jgi:hypothetical protein